MAITTPFRIWGYALALCVGLASGRVAAEPTDSRRLPVQSSAAKAAETTLETSQSLRSRFDRSQWNLSEAEWSRYLELMGGIRGAISPANLSPIEVLGIHARSENERREYALRFAKLMQEDAERVLAFQRAYDDAWKGLNPSGQMFDPRVLGFSSSPAGADASAAPVQAGDRLLLFTRRADCPACAQALETAHALASRADAQLDIYLIDAETDDAIRTWIAQQRFDAARAKAGKITFNHDRGELTQVGGPGATVPALVRLRGGALVALNLGATW